MAKISKKAIRQATVDERKSVRAARRAVKETGQSSASFLTGDAYQNWAAQIGVGTDNQLSGSTYGFNPITRIRTLLEWIYRGSWVGGVAIDIIADDMTRGGIEIQSENKPEDIERLQQALVRNGFWTGLNDTIKNSRLYGGAIGVLLIDGQDVSTPLNIERVGKGDFKGIMVFDRWMVEPTLNDLVTDLGPELGHPKFYKVIADAPALRMKKIHHSRCIRMLGIKLPYWQAVMENLWGLSEFERAYDRMVAFDSATMGMAQLVYKAYVRVYKLKGMRKLLSEGGQGMRAIMGWLELTRRTMGNEGITMIDGDDDMAAQQQTSFTSVDAAVLSLGQQLCGNWQVPLTRFFGQSPAGLNSTGESDMRTYYDGINHKQEMTCRMGVTKAVAVCARSEGLKLGDKWWFSFRPLWQLSELERSEVFARDSQAIQGLEGAGVISMQTALKELRALSRVTGRMTNITDDQIEKASDEAAPSPEDLGIAPGDPHEAGAAGGGAPGPGKADPAGNDPRDKAGDQWPREVYANLPVIVEAKVGQVRWPGANPLLADYGYISGVPSTEGAQEWMDVFLGPDQQSLNAFVIDMQDPVTKRFAEHKVMLGFAHIDEALQAFTHMYSTDHAMGVTPMTTAELREWLDARDFKGPLSGSALAA